MASIAKGLGKSAIAKELGVTTRHSFITKPWALMEEAHASGATSGVIEVAGRAVPWRVSGNGSRRFDAVVPVESLDAFKAQADERPQAGPEHISRGPLSEELHIHTSHPLLEDIWEQIFLQMAGGSEAGTVPVSGKAVPWECFYTARNIKLPFISRLVLDLLREDIRKLPDRAGAGHLSMSRLAEQVGVYPKHPVIAEVFGEIEAKVDAGEKRGVVSLAGGEVPWTLMKATWGGSSKWGGVTPHVPISTVPLFEKAITDRPTSKHSPPDTGKRLYRQMTPKTRGTVLTDLGVMQLDGDRTDLRALRNAVDEDANRLSDLTEFELENEVEIGLLITKPGTQRSVPVVVFAVPSANSNYIFEVFGVRHLVTPDHRVLRRTDVEGRIGWKESAMITVDREFVPRAAPTASAEHRLKG